jgi:hypothetical protein
MKEKMDHREHTGTLFSIHPVPLEKSWREDFNYERIIEKHQIPSFEGIMDKWAWTHGESG